ncbi:ssl1498 family light-harvesting-like protein [Leptolyngbya sp. GB1-A1]|uniref:photosystem II assembly protein Psb34 n=1 Tax=unclassified Leptolyngbya TaxID=2650499 RepID=UPI0019881C6B|nr:ssl1498 family light-harvesting-like protein [Cyanobacteria bacterium FACHB-502]
MTYTADSALDFVSIARELGTTQGLSLKAGVSNGTELTPTEVRSRMRREGRNFLRRPALNGATIDREGLANNYAVEPTLYYAHFPSPEQARQYALQGAIAVLVVTLTLLTAFAVS